MGWMGEDSVYLELEIKGDRGEILVFTIVFYSLSESELSLMIVPLKSATEWGYVYPGTVRNKSLE